MSTFLEMRWEIAFPNKGDRLCTPACHWHIGENVDSNSGQRFAKRPSIEKRGYLQKQDEKKQNKTDLHKA